MNIDEVESTTVPGEVSAKSKPIDRVTLSLEEGLKVQGWLRQIQESSSGFLDITKSDVVNFLISKHAPELSLKEIKAIRSKHYDPIRHLNWITPRLKEALLKNDVSQVAALQSEIRGIELSVVTSASSNTPETDPKPRRKRRDKTDDEPDQP
jgi:hypothetical protein